MSSIKYGLLVHMNYAVEARRLLEGWTADVKTVMTSSSMHIVVYVPEMTINTRRDNPVMISPEYLLQQQTKNTAAVRAINAMDYHLHLQANFPTHVGWFVTTTDDDGGSDDSSSDDSSSGDSDDGSNDDGGEGGGDDDGSDEESSGEWTGT